jgi:hypothetical protein
VHDFRFIVVDNRMAVIGIPESTGEKEATRKGYKVPSEGLAGILKKHFEDCWNKNVSYEEYLRETLEHTGASPEMLAKELNIDKAELERVVSGR